MYSSSKKRIRRSWHRATSIWREKRVGGAIEDSEIVEGMLIDKERVHPGMPKTVADAKILLLNAAVEYKKTEVDAEISITSPDQLQLFLDEEERMIKGIVDKIVNSGANVLFCQKGIDDIAQHYLSKAGIFAIRRVKKSDMEKLARATGGSIISSIDAISGDELGPCAYPKNKGQKPFQSRVFYA